MRNPTRYFLITSFVCFLLGVAGVVAAMGSGRRIYSEWNTATIVCYGVGLSLAYAVVQSFMCVGCMLVILGSGSHKILWGLRILGFVPLFLSAGIYFSLYGGGDPLARLNVIIPIVWTIIIVLMIVIFLLSCVGWMRYAKNKREGFTKDAGEEGGKVPVAPMIEQERRNL